MPWEVELMWEVVCALWGDDCYSNLSDGQTSGGGFARMAGFSVALMGAGRQTAGIVRCGQPRALDLKARRGRRLEQAPAAVMEELLARLRPIIE
jgi:mRNA-degrading endonuclease toxin of MazEF toxin-antitoxin module